MENPDQTPLEATGPGCRPKWMWGFAAGGLIVILLAIFRPSTDQLPDQPVDTSQQSEPGVKRSGSSPRLQLPDRSAASETVPAAEEVVGGKVRQFAHDRLRITQAMAEHFKVEVSPEIERFYEAAASGDWEKIREAFEALNTQRQNGQRAEDLNVLWGPILETFLVAECAHDWPAQKLLDYGHSILESLRPGMVYLGGDDPGRGIPTLLNETSEGERHIIITQNGLADNSYLNYLGFLYGDRMTTLTQEDSQRCFRDYIADAQKRALHDQQFPDEPKQLRPGEDVRLIDNRVEVSGQVAVMAINEMLLQSLMDKNPNMSFALEESFPLKSTYSNAVPLGPIMELRASEPKEAYTPERMAQTVDYWRNTAQQLLSDPEAPEGSHPRKANSHMVAAQGNLLMDHSQFAGAEQLFRIARDLAPENPEGTYRLIDLLAQTGRRDEATQLLSDFVQKNPTVQPPPEAKAIISSRALASP